MQYRRVHTSGGTFFFTVVSFDRQPIFVSDPAIENLRRTIRTVKNRHPFTLDAMVVLPDHLHAIWTLPAGDPDFSTRWMLIKSGFSREFARINESNPPTHSRRRKREQAVWQRRFWEHRIRDEDDFNAHVDYIHYNPVKHGYVAAPRDWRYSSSERWASPAGSAQPTLSTTLESTAARHRYENSKES